MLTVACFFPSDCHLFVYCVEDAVASMMSEVANIDVGLEPVAFCVISPDGKVVLSCDDDGQLETWSTTKGIYEYISHPSVSLCSHSKVFV